MTTTNTKTETNARGNDKPKLPTHVAKVRHGYGKKATYETGQSHFKTGSAAWSGRPHPSPLA